MIGRRNQVNTYESLNDELWASNCLHHIQDRQGTLPSETCPKARSPVNLDNQQAVREMDWMKMIYSLAWKGDY